jgi:phosphoglycerol transferase
MTVRDLDRPRVPRAAEQQIVSPKDFLSRWRELAVPGAGAAFVTFIACWYFKVWNGGLGTPITYSGDGLYYADITNSIIHHGWYFTNSNLGAPVGRVAYDYPLGAENLNLGAIRVFAWVWSNPFLVNNLFLYSTFPAAFLASWFVLRRLGFSKPVAWVVGVVYAILPYHFLRADPHLMLSAYYVVPLGALLLYEFTGASGDRNATRAGREPTPRSWRARGARFVRCRWFWIPVILGSGGIYYASFFVFLAIAAGCLTAVRDRDLRRLVLPAVCSVLVVAVIAINNTPTLLYWARHGSNPAAVDRNLGENDLYGLQVSYLVLPLPDHRLPLFRDVREKLAEESRSPIGDAEGQGLGVLASLGLVVSVGSVLMGVTRRRSEDRWFDFRRRSGELNVVAILLATVGGISTIVGLLGLTGLRSYNRMSIFIAFFSLAALGALCESWLFRRKRGSTRFRVGVMAVSLVVCAVAVFDQVPRALASPRDELREQLSSDRDFAEKIEERLGERGMVFELPLMEYTESKITVRPNVTFQSEELAKPSLFTNDLRWSWGAQRGRPQDLTPSYVGRPLRQLLPDLAVLGFDGIYIDRRGFADHGTEVEAGLTSLLDGQNPMVSRNGDLSFFDLRTYTRGYSQATPRELREAQRRAALHPLRLGWGTGFGPVFGAGPFYPALDGARFGRSAQNGAVLHVTNPLPTTRLLILHFGVNTGDARPATLEVRTSGGAQRFDLPSSTPPTVQLGVPPGETRLTFRIDRAGSDTSGDAPAAFEIVNPWWEGPLLPEKPV